MSHAGLTRAERSDRMRRVRPAAAEIATRYNVPPSSATG